ncbi:hypothetical protein [Flavobacterium sp. UMI-01]|uniref:hypothetical protein n=1 Tax=Flavobacterium sp. UMI-01 TaxID=1441053 RepID=UPI001C7CB1A4|nr:hypothetical protein [Flavobacterium sp. UMI-01]GIZ10122.1 hypothetical protein FUMI01_28480 [Flavobacterium sp. UMI-01]
MKKSIVLLVIAAMMNVTFVSAKVLDPRKSYASTAQELSSFLVPSASVGTLENEEVVTVEFLLTLTGDIVVINAKTENEDLSEYIKEKLNYKKLSTNELTPGHRYKFEVNFK